MKANHGSEYTLSGEVIKKNGNEILLTINHGASKKLPSANWSGGINLKKTGYVIDSTSQWKLKGTSKLILKMTLILLLIFVVLIQVIVKKR